jgi:hypothetical protein
MLSPSTLKALRLIALSETQEGYYDVWYDSICRWYSRQFHTPLKQVEDMADEYVIRTYYRDVYWTLANGDEKQKNIFAELVLDALKQEHPEYKAAMAAINADDDAYVRELEEEAKRIEVKQAAVKSKKMQATKKPSGMAPKPNLKKEVISVQADDPIPDDEGP